MKTPHKHKQKKGPHHTSSHKKEEKKRGKQNTITIFNYGNLVINGGRIHAETGGQISGYQGENANQGGQIAKKGGQNANQDGKVIKKY